MAAQPTWAPYTRVDTLLECYEITDATGKALIAAMPNAYGVDYSNSCTAHTGKPDPSCGNCRTAEYEDAWPEPDAARDEAYKLSKIWEKLAPEVQADVLKAYAKNHSLRSQLDERGSE